MANAMEPAVEITVWAQETEKVNLGDKDAIGKLAAQNRDEY